MRAMNAPSLPEALEAMTFSSTSTAPANVAEPSAVIDDVTLVP